MSLNLDTVTLRIMELNALSFLGNTSNKGGKKRFWFEGHDISLFFLPGITELEIVCIHVS